MRSETLSRLLKNTGNHLTRAAQNRARALAITYRAATGREQSAPEPVTGKSLPVSNAGVSRIGTKTGYLLLTRAVRNRPHALAITYRAATGRGRSRGAVFQHPIRHHSASEPVTIESWPVSNAGVSRIWTKAGNRLLTSAVRNRAHELAIAYRAASGRGRSRGAVFQHPIRHRSASEPVTIESWQVSNGGVSRILTKTRHLLLTRAARNRPHALAIAYRVATGREQSHQTVCQRPLRSILTSSSRALDPHVR